MDFHIYRREKLSVRAEKQIIIKRKQITNIIFNVQKTPQYQFLVYVHS